MSETVENRLASMSQDKIKALVQKLNKASGADIGLPKIERRPGQRYPLSGAQERLWFLSQFAPDSRAANNPGALRARTSRPLDFELFRQSVEEVGRRHEILRTTFHSDNGQPVQVVHEELPLKFSWDDLSLLPPDERERAAEKIAVADGRQEFDLETGPLLTMKILRFTDLDYMLLITSHHIVSDGWSMAMFATEVASIYNALEKGVPHELPEPECQYLDYVFWEREWIKKGGAESHLNYWKNLLFDAPPPLELPTDFPRPHIKSDAGGIEKLTIGAAQAETLRTFAKNEGASLFQVLIAAFNVLLFRYSGQEDFVIGTSAANRNMRQFQNVMGLFINTLPIRSRIDGEGSFREYLRKTQTTCQEAMLHQKLPFEKLIVELNPRRNLNAHPFFQVMFVHQNVPSLYVVPGMRLELFKVDYETSKFDLTLWVEEINGEFLLTLYYSRDLFEAATIKKMLSRYRLLLESVANEPDCPVKDISCFSPEEIVFALTRQNAVNKESAANAIFHRRFENRVEIHPDNTAAECGDEKLTYRELNAEANKLARHLQKSVVKSGEIVALLTRRNPQMLAAALGIMKAGGAYLPLNETHPPKFLKTIIDDSGAAVLITEEYFRPVAETLPVRAVYLDSQEVSQNNDDNLELDAAESSLAYVIYTSGTTGEPKGVCIEHRNLVNYCDAVWREMKLSANDKFSALSDLSADLGNTAVFPPLLNGGSVIIVPRELTTDAGGLADYFSRQPADCLKIVPAHLQALLQSKNAKYILPKKLLILGGEATSNELLEIIRNLNPDCRILNHYGPTECTVGTLTFECEEDTKTPPLGFPLAGNRVYVLDKYRNPLPVGIGGELYIGGAQLARGYLNRRELTAERFIKNPFAPSERLYRTGDKAKFLADGAVAFLGRIDRQIKIRGYRVELAEIESVLSRRTGVERAVVLQSPDNDQHLTAFVKMKPDSTLDAQILKEYLGEHLPFYMIPGEFAFIEIVPQTPSGKIDYQTLLQIETETPKTVHSAPRDRTELELLHILQELLDNREIGIEDDFFDAGGHSLLGVRLMSRIEESFGQRLPLASLFEHGTVANLAKLIRREETVGQNSPLVCIKKGDSGSNLFFVHPAGGNVLCYYELARSLGNKFTFYGLQADGGASASITAMARKYLDSVLTVAADGAPIVGGWSMGALVAFEMAWLYAQDHGNFPTVAVLDQIAPEDYRNGSKKPEIEDTSRLLTFAGKVSQLIGKDLGVKTDTLAGETFTNQAAAFLDRFKAVGLAPENTAAADFQGFLELMLKHNDMTTEYAPGVYPGKILVFRAEDALSFDPVLSEAAEFEINRPPDLGWQKFSSQTVEIIQVPGNHVSMITAPNARTLAEKLAQNLV